MKSPNQMNVLKDKNNLSKTINKLSDKPQWVEADKNKNDLVNITFRAPSSLKEKLETQAKINKNNGESPNTVTDFLLRALSQYIKNNPDEFQ
ncbi:MAG TPA: hypothetical protein H9887_01560 [Candidatus Dorea intestinavium]|nr:hypothetical protein [Candidatus Dorea intestinavium]